MLVAVVVSACTANESFDPTSRVPSTGEGPESAFDKQALEDNLTVVNVLGDDTVIAGGDEDPLQWIDVLSQDTSWTVNVSAEPGAAFLPEEGEQVALSGLLRSDEQFRDATADLVVIAGGSNDLESEFRSIRSGVLKTLRETRRAFPSSDIVFFTPWRVDGDRRVEPFARALTSAGVRWEVEVVDTTKYTQREDGASLEELRSSSAVQARIAERFEDDLARLGLPRSDAWRVPKQPAG